MRPDLLDRVLSLLPARSKRPELQLLFDMLRDYPQRGGKGIRSELLLASARAHGVTPGSERWEGALWLAAALEMFQNWVLIHDDIEDDSEERRGDPPSTACTGCRSPSTRATPCTPTCGAPCGVRACPAAWRNSSP